MEQGLAEIHWDLDVDLLTARAFLAHYNPFTPEGAVRSGLAASGPAGNGHPPTTSFWFLPLAQMDSRTAGAALAWVSVLVLLLQLAATLNLLRCPAPLVSAWLGLTFILGCSFLKYHLAVGQSSALIGFLYFVGWYAGRTGKTSDDWLAGAALGAACTFKMFPGLMMVPFLLAFRWRVLVGGAAVYLTVAAIMTAGFGLSSWPLFMAQQAPIANLWMDSVQNQSIHGIVLRLFTPVCVPHRPVLMAATLISITVSLMFIAGAIWLVRRTVRAGGFDLAYALFVVLSVVTSQWTWEHYTVIYVLPVLLLGNELVGRWRVRQQRRAVGALLFILTAVVASWRIDMETKRHLQLLVHQGSRQQHLLLHLYDVLNWAPALVLLAMLAVVCRWKKRELASSAVGSRTAQKAGPVIAVQLPVQ